MNMLSSVVREGLISLQTMQLYGHQTLSSFHCIAEHKMGGSIHTLKENAEALVAVTREIGLEVSADKTKYMVMSRDHNAGRNHSVRIDNSNLELRHPHCVYNKMSRVRSVKHNYLLVTYNNMFRPTRRPSSG